MKRTLFTVLALIIVVLLVGWVFRPSTTGPIEQQAVEQAEEKVVVKVNTGKEQFSYELEDAVGTALEVTIQATGGRVETQGKGEMAFVTSINGREAIAENREFWELVINGELSQVGAGSYMVQPADTIEWRISTY